MHAHKTGSWYLFGVLYKISDEQPRLFYMGVPPGSITRGNSMFFFFFISVHILCQMSWLLCSFILQIFLGNLFS